MSPLVLAATNLTSTSPVYGAILLFKYPKKQPESRDGTLDEAASYNLFFANQVIQNACATQAILSILLNRTGLDPSDKSHPAGGENPDPVDADVNIGDMLIAFKDFAKEFPPEVSFSIRSKRKLLTSTIGPWFSTIELRRNQNCPQLILLLFAICR
jgi:hypothetical protein